MNKTIRSLHRRYNLLSVQKKVVLWFTFANFLSKGVSFLTTPIFTRLLTTEQYGIYSVYNAWSDIFIVFVTLNLHMAVMNNAFMKLDDSNEKVISSFQGLSLSLSIFWLIFYIIFNKWISPLLGMSFGVTIAMFISFLFIPSYNYWQIYKRYQYDYKSMVSASIAVTTLVPIVGIILVLLFPDYAKGEARIYGQIIVFVVVGALFMVINWRRDHSFYDHNLWRYALSFNIPMIPHFLSLTILNSSDRIMIEKYYSTSEAGIYSVAYSASSLILLITSAINTALVPWSYEQLRDKNYKTMANVFYKILFGIEVIVMLMIAFAPEIIKLLAGSAYMNAVDLIPALAAGVFFSYMYQVIARVGLFYGHTRYTLAGTVSAALINLVLNYVLIPVFGYKMAGYTTLISYIVLCIMHYIFYIFVCNKYIDGIRIYSKKILFGLSLFMIAISVVMSILYRYVFLRYLSIAIVVLVLYLLKDQIKNTVLTIVKEPSNLD